jgi:hypothetical protein
VPEVNKEVVVQVLSEGQCIKHEQYGYGIVAESDGERTTIDFDSVGMKKFVTGLMAMELVGDAPERPTKPRQVTYGNAKFPASDVPHNRSRMLMHPRTVRD